MKELSIGDAFSKIEKAAEAWKLSTKETNTLRLLGEEMVGMTENLVNVKELEFSVISEEKKFELILTAKADISPDKKKEFSSASTSKKNQKEKGLKGKISSMIENYFYYAGSDPISPAMPYGGVVTPASGYLYSWSMESYLESTPKEKQLEDWDGLEKSILINFADDITIGVTTQQLEIKVKKQF